MIDIEFDPETPTNTLVPSGLTLTPSGAVPTVTVLATVFVETSMTETVLPPLLVT
jgi:hypothetical protein